MKSEWTNGQLKEWNFLLQMCYFRFRNSRLIFPAVIAVSVRVHRLGEIFYCVLVHAMPFSGLEKVMIIIIIGREIYEVL